MSIKKTDKKLTPKQRIFLNTYLTNGFNATQAAITAGYSKKTAYSIGSENLKKPEIIEALNRELQCGQVVTRQILQELHKIATSDIKDFIELDSETGAYKQKKLEDIPEGMTSVINDIDGYRKIAESNDGSKVLVTDTFKFKLYDKQKALSDYVKILGLAQPDKLDITSGGEPLEPTVFNIYGKSDK